MLIAVHDDYYDDDDDDDDDDNENEDEGYDGNKYDDHDCIHLSMLIARRCKM